MTAVAVHAAETHVSQLVAKVEAGEEVVILLGTEPVVRLVPADEPAPKRVVGALAGEVVVTEALVEVLPAEERATWEG